MGSSMQVTGCKAVGLAILFVVTVVGCYAHFESTARDLYKEPALKAICKFIKQCPENAMAWERTFVALTIICLILSALSFVAGFLTDLSKLKTADAGYHCLAAVLLIIAGALMLTSAIKLDDLTTSPELTIGSLSKEMSSLQSLLRGNARANDFVKEVRKEVKYVEKMAAGVMGIINGLFYFATAAIIMKSG